jgi:uncharacterized protein (DUF2147 family)
MNFFVSGILLVSAEHSNTYIHYMKSVIIVFCLFAVTGIYGQHSVFGKWTTIDDNTGKPRSIVEVYEKNGKLYGKVIKIYYRDGEKEDPVCHLCSKSDSRYMKKVIGMDIFSGLTKNDDEWENGTILDPDNGKEYDCKVWLEDGKLQVRGYISIFFRTQTWIPYK